MEGLEGGLSWEGPIGPFSVTEWEKQAGSKRGSCDHGRVTTLTQFAQDFPDVSTESLIPWEASVQGKQGWAEAQLAKKHVEPNSQISQQDRKSVA